MTYNLCRFVRKNGVPQKRVHAVKVQPSKLWVGITWCGRRGELLDGPLSSALGPTCPACRRELRRQ